MKELFPAHEIAARVHDLGAAISRDYADRQFLVVGVLHGSVVLVADLIRAITIPHQIAFVRASSYLGNTTIAGQLTTSLEGLPDVAGRHVLLVDDICDTGQTLARLCQQLQTHNAASVRTAVLLWKRSRTTAPVEPDYAAFEIPDEFVVGYGLDYNGDYRHLPYIAVLEASDLPVVEG